MSEKLLKPLKGGNHVFFNGHMEELLPYMNEIITHFVSKPEEGSPRVLILCLNDEHVRRVSESLTGIVKANDLTVDLITEKGNKLKQRNDLFDGTEIIVGTVKRSTELYFQNGFNMGKIKFVAILDADQMMRNSLKGNLIRLAESLPKCRFLISALQTEDERLVDFQKQFCHPYLFIE